MPPDKMVLLISIPTHSKSDAATSSRIREHLQSRGFTVLNAMPDFLEKDEELARQQMPQLTLTRDDVTPACVLEPDSQPWYRRFSKSKKF